jgi:hypothetical protein
MRKTKKLPTDQDRVTEDVPRLIHEFIKEEKAGAKHE